MPSLLQLSAVLLAGASAAFARPTISTRQVSNSTSPNVTSGVTVTGATEGGVQSRLEIHELMQDADAWNIYLLAMQAFQSMDPSDPLSWYQIGGIHGKPFVEYNDAPQCEGCDPEMGYCTHLSTLFPTWHRAYVALFEQSLQANALAIAGQFTGDDRQRYLAAASNLRAPYWDWALAPAQGEEALPQFFMDATVAVNTPSGQQEIANPLLQYTFPSLNDNFAAGQMTTREPRMSIATRQQSRSDLWTLLTSQSDYNAFSTSALDAPRDNPGSLEAIHNSIHFDIGGTMNDPETAGFDPAFWLHHAMVDRVLALYQAAWPETWLQSMDQVGDTFTFTSGSIQDSESILEPFAVSSNTIKDTSYYNYNYADLASGASPADIINDLYGATRSPSTNPPGVQTKRSVTFSRDNSTYQYIAKVESDLPGTEGSFDLFIFDGAPDNVAPEKWFQDADFLGQHGFFTNAAAKGNHEQISHASISLTAALQRRVDSGELADLQPETVARHLRDGMYWRVVDRFDKEIPNSKVPMLQLNVLVAEVEMPTERGAMPVWGKFRQLVGCENDIGAYINGWCANV